MPATDSNLINQSAQWLGARTGGQLVRSPAAQLLIMLAGIFLFAVVLHFALYKLVLPEFGLRVPQEPGGYDLHRLAEGRAQAAVGGAT